MTTSIAHRINWIRQQIPPQVRLIAVTKQVPIAAMRQAYEMGVRDFGENRVQEAINKQQELEDLVDINWHFIGHIQKNKAKKVIEHFQWIHSVDSLGLAQRLDRLAGELNQSPQTCLQVKMLADPNKYGWQPSELLTELPRLNQCQFIKIQGLMTILPLGLSLAEILTTFQETKQLATKIQQQNYSRVQMKELSMGMSGDYLQAISAGATMIRLGRTIFHP